MYSTTRYSCPLGIIFSSTTLSASGTRRRRQVPCVNSFGWCLQSFHVLRVPVLCTADSSTAYVLQILGHSSTPAFRHCVAFRDLLVQRWNQQETSHQRASESHTVASDWRARMCYDLQDIVLDPVTLSVRWLSHKLVLLSTSSLVAQCCCFSFRLVLACSVAESYQPPFPHNACSVPPHAPLVAQASPVPDP